MSVSVWRGREPESCEELHENDKLWLVPPGRVFMWPTFKVGHRVQVRHVDTANGRPIVVETLAKMPRVSRARHIVGASGRALGPAWRRASDDASINAPPCLT